MVSEVLKNTTRVIMFEGFRIASLYILLGNKGEATQVPAWYLKSEGPAGGDLCVILDFNSAYCTKCRRITIYGVC